MHDLLKAARLLLLDLASTIVFLLLFLATHDTILSVTAGIALGAIQIAIHLVRGRPVQVMEWLSLFLIVAAGTATLLTDDPRFVLFKPSVIYAVLGIVMLKSGWLVRYLPEVPRAVSPDIAVAVGYAWAVLMFVTAAVNAVVAIACSVPIWAIVMLIFGIVSKVIVFIAGFLAIRLTTVRRVRALPGKTPATLLVSTEA